MDFFLNWRFVAKILNSSELWPRNLNWLKDCKKWLRIIRFNHEVSELIMNNKKKIVSIRGSLGLSVIPPLGERLFS